MSVAADPTVMRSRVMRVNIRLLNRINPNDSFEFNLFEDATFVADLQIIKNRNTWIGTIQGEEAGTFTLINNDGVLSAIVRVPDKDIYRIRSVGDGVVVIQETDEARFPPCANGPAQGVVGGDGVAVGAGCDDGSVIDVLVVYTPIARAAAGGTAAIEAEIDLAIAAANDAYQNSLVTTQLNVVHLGEVDYDESGDYVGHLYRLTDPSDGFMDNVHQLRALYAADMVALIVNDGEYCGIAWLMNNLSPDFEDMAFSVTTWYCAANLVLAHELGHNMGCCHAPGDGGGCVNGGLYSYSVGYRYFGNSGTQWRTVMAYSPGTRIPYFSNPDVIFDGQPTGVPAGDPDEAENARTINETAYIISNFRCHFSEGDFVEVDRLFASDGGANDQLGRSVAVNGDTAVVGASQDDDNGSNSGSAYVFRFNGSTWEQEQKLLPSNGASGDRFGYAVALSGDTVIVGAWGDNDLGVDSGSAYVYRFDGSSWVQEQQLHASKGETTDRFGYTVAFSGDTVIIGTPGDDDAGPDSGSAFVYRFDQRESSWVEVQKLLAPDAEPGDNFGGAVASAGTAVVIGTPFDDDHGTDSGAAYVFRFDGSTWILEQKLNAAAGAAGDNFGHSVAVSGDTIVAGAWYNDDTASNAGSAYVFRFEDSTWIEEQKLLASDGADDNLFGTAVAVRSGTVIIGARNDNDNNPLAGSAYVYHFNPDGSQWIEEQKLLASVGTPGDQFGSSVAISGDTVVIGARVDNINCDNCGAAYVFVREPIPGIPGDIDGNGAVGAADLLILLANWGPCGDCNDCPADLDDDCTVGAADLLILLANWG